eukprot:6400377-Amphidinium_carterae.1
MEINSSKLILCYVIFFVWTVHLQQNAVGNIIPGSSEVLSAWTISTQWVPRKESSSQQLHGSCQHQLHEGSVKRKPPCMHVWPDVNLSQGQESQHKSQCRGQFLKGSRGRSGARSKQHYPLLSGRASCGVTGGESCAASSALPAGLAELALEEALPVPDGALAMR